MDKNISQVSSYLKNKIMKRVYAIWVLRRVFSPFAIKTAFLVVVILEALSYYSLSNIFNNIILASGNFSAFSGYLVSALQNTAIISKLLFIGLMAVTFLFVQELFKILQKKRFLPEISQ